MPVRSAGVVIFREGKKFLLLLYPGGYWDFPKGHMEPGETSEQTALRELKEETGISKTGILPGFKETIRYYYVENGKRFLKFVVFYIAETKQKKVKISWEHRDFIWLPYKEALKKLTYQNAKNVLKKAERWLVKHEK